MGGGLQSRLLRGGRWQPPRSCSLLKHFPCHERASSPGRCCSGKALGGSSGSLPSACGMGLGIWPGQGRGLPPSLSRRSWPSASATPASTRSWRPRCPRWTAPSPRPAAICESAAGRGARRGLGGGRGGGGGEKCVVCPCAAAHQLRDNLGLGERGILVSSPGFWWGSALFLEVSP